MMGSPAGPDSPRPPPAPDGEPVTCPGCGWRQDAMTCTTPACDNRFFPQPGYSRSICPHHDPLFGDGPIPAGFRDYKMQKARACIRCADRLL
jgi:hypothetical protein